MANTNLRTVDPGSEQPAWVQPTRYISVPVAENNRGHFIEVPQISWLPTVAQTAGANAANTQLDALADYMASEAKAAANKKEIVKKNDANAEREAINTVVSKIANGSYDTGDISGRDDFNRALLAAAKDTLRNALLARGEANPSEARIAEAFKANYSRAMERFGAEVAATGYQPVKKATTKAAATPTEKPGLGGLEF